MTTEFGLLPNLPTLRQKPGVGARLAQSPITRGLVGFWPFLEGAGRRVNNYAQQSKFGTLNSATKWAGYGNRNHALDFQASNSRLDAENVPAFAITGSLTISCWAFVYTLPGNGVYPRLVSRLHSPSGFQGYEMVLAANDSGSGLVNRAVYMQYAKNGSLSGKSDTIAMPTGRWVHYVGTFDGGTGNTYIFRDGFERASAFVGTGAIGDGANQVYIGGHPTLGPQFPGYLDMPAIWNRRLTNAEIYYLFDDPYCLFEQPSTASRVIFNFETSATYEKSLNIDGNAACTLADGGTLYREKTVDGIAAITLANQYTMYTTVNLTAIGDLLFKIPYLLELSVAGVSAITLLDGQQWQNNFAIEGIANLTLTPGIGYFDTVDTEVICDLTINEEAFTLLELDIDGIADITVSTLQNGRIGLTVAGVSAVTVEPNFSYIIDLSMAGIATLYRGSDLNGGGDDGLHNFMALTSNDTLAVALHRETPGNQNPSSAGSVSVECQAVLNRTITQTLSLTQSAAIKKPTEIIDTLIFVSQSATCVRVRIREATNTITFTHDAEAYRAFAQSVTFTDQATVTKVMARTVTQTLTMTQAANRTTVLNRTLTDTLVMGQNRLVRTPIFGTIHTASPTPFEYYQPVAQAVLVPINCLVVLGVPAQTIILPCPQFGDSQGRTDSINLKRTMTGDTYTYVRKSELQKLKYTFQMGSYKAVELKQFLVDHCHEVMTLINHKGETWYVNLTNNPFEFVAAERWQKRGERHDVTLEFEGVQL